MTTRELTHHRASRGASEDGIALFYALLAALVVAGIVTVVAVSAMGEARQSAFELDFEDSLHVAESGLEVTMQRLDDDSLYATTHSDDGSMVLGPSSTEDTFEWAVTKATETDASGNYRLPAVDFGEGEAVAIRPSGRDANYAYGIGFTPSRDAYVDDLGEVHVRVVRINIGFTDTEVAGQFAILAGGQLTSISSSYGVLGLNGSVHTNGQLDLQHDNVEGDITFSGECTGSVCPSDPPEDTDEVVGPVPQEPLPDSTIDDLWDRPAAREIAAEDGVHWYDYCDGTGRHTGDQGKGWYERGANDTEPCTGTWLGGAGEPTGWSGLDLKNVDDPDAVFWLDSTAETTVTKAQGRLSVLSLGDIRFSTSANATGMEAKYPGLLMYTEGDAEVGGNLTSVDPEGSIIYSGGDLRVRGTADSVGIAYLTQGTAEIKGGAEVSYDGDAVADIGGDGDPLVLGWEEVS